MNDYALHLLKKYRSEGIIIDTNILLVYIVGSVDTKLIKQFKRTSIFEEKDYKILADYIESFEAQITTPSILTEVSNFLEHIPKQKDKCFYAMKQSITVMKEDYSPSREISENHAFEKFGLTDASIAKIAKGKYAVITVDFPLYHYLSSLGYDILNYNHIRDI